MQRKSIDVKAEVEKAYDKYASELYQYALMILADRGAAEDAVQQAFIKIIKMGNRVSQIESYNGYLRMAVRNECYGIIKTREKFGCLIKNLHPKPILEELNEKITTENEHELIENAIKKLPAEQREVLHMKVYEDKTFSDIGKMTGISTNTVASRYRYAMDKLRGILIFNNRTNRNHHE